MSLKNSQSNSKSKSTLHRVWKLIRTGDDPEFPNSTERLDRIETSLENLDKMKLKKIKSNGHL